jgi:hypothetical protein
MAVNQQAADNALSNFLYALKAPETKRQWHNRLKVVFRFLGSRMLSMWSVPACAGHQWDKAIKEF